jgi:hypothetical protein
MTTVLQERLCTYVSACTCRIWAISAIIEGAPRSVYELI